MTACPIKLALSTRPHQSEVPAQKLRQTPTQLRGLAYIGSFGHADLQQSIFWALQWNSSHWRMRIVHAGQAKVCISVPKSMGHERFQFHSMLGGSETLLGAL